MNLATYAAIGGVSQQLTKLIAVRDDHSTRAACGWDDSRIQIRLEQGRAARPERAVGKELEPAARVQADLLAAPPADVESPAQLRRANRRMDAERQPALGCEIAVDEWSARHLS